MPDPDLAGQRLRSQRLLTADFETPADVVRWFGAVQAQDYAAAKWALALRMPRATEAEVEQALADGSILRTHVMRPTWHFVAPEDIRWLLALTAPRVHAANAYYYRQLAIEGALFTRSHAALAKALQGGRQLTRPELGAALGQAGITASGVRLTYLVLGAELDGVICSGARRGKAFTYALLEERVPLARSIEHDAALAELTRRYFTSHGPASLADFRWWSGLATTDVRRGLDIVQDGLQRQVVDGLPYWSAASPPPVSGDSPAILLLPNYDEYVVAYTDRSAIFDASQAAGLDARHNPLFQHTIVIEGQIAGTWRRILKRGALVLELKPFTPLAQAHDQALARAARRYAAYLGSPLSAG